jgi:hypothetical protein
LNNFRSLRLILLYRSGSDCNYRSGIVDPSQNRIIMIYHDLSIYLFHFSIFFFIFIFPQLFCTPVAKKVVFEGRCKLFSDTSNSYSFITAVVGRFIILDFCFLVHVWNYNFSQLRLFMMLQWLITFPITEAVDFSYVC